MAGGVGDVAGGRGCESNVPPTSGPGEERGRARALVSAPTQIRLKNGREWVGRRTKADARPFGSARWAGFFVRADPNGRPQTKWVAHWSCSKYQAPTAITCFTSKLGFIGIGLESARIRCSSMIEPERSINFASSTISSIPSRSHNSFACVQSKSRWRTSSASCVMD